MVCSPRRSNLHESTAKSSLTLVSHGEYNLDLPFAHAATLLENGRQTQTAFLQMFCFCLFNCSLVKTGHLLQSKSWQSALVAAKPARSEPRQLCSELPTANPLAPKIASPLWHCAKKEPDQMGKREISWKKAHFLVVNSHIYHSWLLGKYFCTLVCRGVCTKRNIYSWTKRNNTENWLSSLSCVTLEERTFLWKVLLHRANRRIKTDWKPCKGWTISASPGLALLP